MKIVHPGRTDPVGIVKVGISEKKNYDQIFCVIDRDTHANFESALNDADQNGIVVIASYPCYEFWLLLHFRYTRSPYVSVGLQSAADRVIDDLRRIPEMSAYAKGQSKDLWELLLSKHATARLRSAQAFSEANADGEKNPSTRLHELMVRLEELGNLEPAG